MAEVKQKLDILGDNQLPVNRPALKPSKPIPSVQEVIGRALDKIGTYSDLDNRFKSLFCCCFSFRCSELSALAI